MPRNETLPPCLDKIAEELKIFAFKYKYLFSKTLERQNHHDNILYTTTMSLFEYQIHLKSDMLVKTLPIQNFGLLWQNWDSYYKLKGGNDYHESEIVIGTQFCQTPLLW